MMKRYFKILTILSVFAFWIINLSFADTCLKPFPQAVTYPYGIKPNQFSQAQMNQHCLDWFNKWRAKYVTQNGCGAGEWRLQRIETGNMISKGCSENDTVSEGIGYGMVIMAYMSSATNNTKQYFDGMYLYYKNHLDGSGLMNWQIPYCDSGGSATDADEDVAMALLMAEAQWGNGTTNYHNEANTIIGRILGSEITTANDVRPGDGWDGANISYFAPYEYRMFGDHTGTARWFSVASHSYQTVVNYYYNSLSTTNAALGIKTGLQPNWCDYDGTPRSPGTWAMRADTWWWDAIRHAWRQGYDYVLYGTQNDHLALDNSARLSYFFKTKYGGNPELIKSQYTLDGTETTYCRGDRTPDLCSEDVKNLPGPLGAVAIAAMAEGDQGWLNACYYQLVTMNAGTGSGELTDTGVAWGTDYFCDILKMQYLLILTGNMPNPLGDYPPPTITMTPTISNTITPGPSPTDTPTIGPGMFDDFETGALRNLDSSAGGQTGFTTITNATDRFQSGTHSIKIVSTANSWGAFGIDSPYSGILGYRNYTGATALEFDIYSTVAISFFAKIVEANANGGDGEIYSNRASQSSAVANSWVHISIPITNIAVFKRDQYDTKTGTNNVMNLSAISSFYIQIDAAPNANIWIDNINFTGTFPAATSTFTATKTRTPYGTSTFTRTNTPFYSATISPTPSITPTVSSTPTDTPYFSATITRTPTITPTYTLTPNIPFGVFDDFETGTLKNPSTTDTGGGATLVIANTGIAVHAGTRAMSAVTTGTGWAVVSIDSPYDGGAGYRNFTGATSMSFWINAPTATGLFVKIVESNGQQWSNRDAAFTTGAAGWQQITLLFSNPQFTVDAYSPAGDTVFDTSIIKTVTFQFNNPGAKTIYIDDVVFAGMPIPTATSTETRTPTSSRTPSVTVTPVNSITLTITPVNTETRTPTPSRTPSVTVTPVNSITLTTTPVNTETRTNTPTLTQTFTLTETKTFTPSITPTFTFSIYSPTISPTHTLTSTKTATPTIANSATNTNTLVPTASYTATFTQTKINSATFTHTVTLSETVTYTLTATQTSSVTYTYTISPTWTISPTGTPPTLTVTPTITVTLTHTQSPTFTATKTYTPSVTITSINTATFTYTSTIVSTQTNTPVNSFTLTLTKTAVITNTFTPTATLTITNVIYTPTVTFTATKEPRFLEITDPIIYPCPYNPDISGDLKLKIKLSKSCNKLKFKVYTRGYRNIFIDEKIGNFSGDTTVSFAADNFKKFSNGAYFYVVYGENDVEKAISKMDKFIIIR